MAQDADDPFGTQFKFTFGADTDGDVQRYRREADRAKEKTKQMFDAVSKLLDRLSVDPHLDIIKWPGKDRVAQIKAFKERLETINNE